MNGVIPVLTFAVRHLLFVVMAMLAACVLWTVAYVALCVIAIVGNQDLGGPLGYPAGILVILVTGIALGWGIFAPASAIGALCCGLLKWPRFAAIPVVSIAAYSLSYLLYGVYIGWGTTHSMPSGWIVLKNFAVFLSIPLGIYWWLTEGPGALFDAFRRWMRNRRSPSALSRDPSPSSPP